MINLKQLGIVVFVLLIFSVSITAYVTKTQFPEYVEVEKTGQIDSTKWISRATYVDQSQLIKELDKEFRKSIKASDRKISSLTKLNGQLKLERDSLYSKVDSLFDGANSTGDVTSLPSDSLGGIQDTTITTKEIFGDGLFLVTSDVSIYNNQLTNQLHLKQLRKIDITIATALSDDNSEVFTYIESKDFEELNIENKTGLERDNKFPKFWVGVGTGVGAVAILNLILLR